MTDLLKKAFDAASRLPEDEQDAVAEWLLAELASEEGWDKRVAETQGALSSLTREALGEHEKNQTRSVVNSRKPGLDYGYARDHNTG